MASEWTFRGRLCASAQQVETDARRARWPNARAPSVRAALFAVLACAGWMAGCDSTNGPAEAPDDDRSVRADETRAGDDEADAPAQADGGRERDARSADGAKTPDEPRDGAAPKPPPASDASSGTAQKPDASGDASDEREPSEGDGGAPPAQSDEARASAGCSMGGTVKAGHTNETIMVGSRRREFVQHVPASYDGKKPYALLIDFHGGTYDGMRWDARASNKFKQMSETENFIYIAPTGLNQWWTTTDGAEGADGMFMRALIDQLKKTSCIDEKRVYTTGCSMGGDMSFYMACYFSDVVAASLPMCGSSAFDLDKECKPTRPISLRFVIGSKDSLNCWEPPRTSVGNPCATEVQATFKRLNGCTDQAEKTHGGVCETHDECMGGTEVTICMLNATHTGIYMASDMDVYKEGWEYLKRYTLP